MCGIAGIWLRDGRKVERSAIDRFSGSLAHRGPDGQGSWTTDDGRLALAHRRLAILDLSSAGDQPMTSFDQRHTITYKGEIYNSVELRSDWRAIDSASALKPIQKGSDPCQLRRWGPDCLLRFNGMWSFAIWDQQERTLFLARDRFGVKPLC